jgi:2-keto-4-pentenoate hydratase/2-oxohepta-3-ene-1,7-dioic acid hydratase in catechol pathway
LKIVSYYRPDGKPSWGLWAAAGVRDAHHCGTLVAPSFEALLSEGNGDGLALLAEWDRSTDESDALLDPNVLTWRSPIPVPRRNIFCLGPNYRDHIEESPHSDAVPAEPIYFTKATTTVTGHRSVVQIDPAITQQVDWEIELGVVLGRGGRNIDVDEALNHVFGYTIINDLSARDQQHGRPEHQWFLGKSLDGFCPMGPAVTTADEVPDPQLLDMSLRVNGAEKQLSNTRNMIFSVADIVADLSRYVTLLPGDIISTGTPGGVGAARVPPEFLTDGDVVSATISRLGQLDCVMRAA